MWKCYFNIMVTKNKNDNNFQKLPFLPQQGCWDTLIQSDSDSCSLGCQGVTHSTNHMSEHTMGSKFIILTQQICDLSCKVTQQKWWNGNFLPLQSKHSFLLSHLHVMRSACYRLKAAASLLCGHLGCTRHHQTHEIWACDCRLNNHDVLCSGVIFYNRFIWQLSFWLICSPFNNKKQKQRTSYCNFTEPKLTIVTALYYCKACNIQVVNHDCTVCSLLTPHYITSRGWRSCNTVRNLLFTTFVLILIWLFYQVR